MRLMLLGLVLMLSGCSKSAVPAPKGGSDVPPSKVNLKRLVELAQVEQRSLVYSVETVGVLEAEATTPIAPGVSGVVDEVKFREGDIVKKGQTLVLIDQKRYLTAQAVARAAVERAQANLRLAQDTYARATQSRGATSEQERDTARGNLNVAQAEFQSAVANLDLANHNLERSQVQAPYSGQINTRTVSPGAFVEDKTTIGTIADLSRLRLVGYVPESAAPTLRRLMSERSLRVELNRSLVPLGGMTAGPVTGIAGLLAATEPLPSGFDPEFTVLPYPGRVFRAEVFFMSTVADPSTHMFESKAEIRLADREVELRPGFTARIRYPLQSTARACVIPEESVRSTERGMVAFEPIQRVAKDGSREWVARVRPLELGYRSPGWVEVRYGLKPGQLIVRRGADALEDGTPIRFAGE